MTIRFKATDEQVAQLMANAVNASQPMGLGVLHFRHGDKLAAEFMNIAQSDNPSLDYYEGRMVKLYLSRDGDYWTLHPDEPRSDYQSWCGKYPTARALVESAGGQVI